MALATLHCFVARVENISTLLGISAWLLQLLQWTGKIEHSCLAQCEPDQKSGPKTVSQQAAKIE